MFTRMLTGNFYYLYYCSVELGKLNNNNNNYYYYNDGNNNNNNNNNNNIGSSSENYI